MVKIRILTALWQRPEITRICFEGIKRLRAYKPDQYQIEATAVASENGFFRPLCEEYDIEYVQQANNPLGLKWHVGLQACLEHDFDFLMLVGSDDLISDSLLDLYVPYYEEYYVFGINDLYIYSTDTGKARYFPGYDSKPMSIGAGRMIHREVIESCGNKLWPFRVNRGLDGNSLRRIRSCGFDEEVIKTEGRAAILDIKSEVNLNKFGDFYGDLIDPSKLEAFFPEMDLIRVLK